MKRRGIFFLISTTAATVVCLHADIARAATTYTVAASGSKLSFAVCMAMGIFVSRWISRLKADKHPAFALHWLYWHLPTNPATSMRATPPSHIRRMVG